MVSRKGLCRCPSDAAFATQVVVRIHKGTPVFFLQTTVAEQVTIAVRISIVTKSFKILGKEK